MTRGSSDRARRAGLAVWQALVLLVVIVVLVILMLRWLSASSRREADVSSPAAAVTTSPGMPSGPRARATPGTPSGATPVVIMSVDPTALNRNPPLRPDPSLTPGDTLPVTAQDVCTPGYSKKVRNVPSGVKRQAYAQYGIEQRATGEFEVDHLISLELGGSNSIRNLWPQSFMTHPWNAHVKDAIENELHRQVCAGTMSLHDAQRAIATDWIAAYRRVLHRDLPASP